jgi:hypothetical protein
VFDTHIEFLHFLLTLKLNSVETAKKNEPPGKAKLSKSLCPKSLKAAMAGQGWITWWKLRWLDKDGSPVEGLVAEQGWITWWRLVAGQGWITWWKLRWLDKAGSPGEGWWLE